MFRTPLNISTERLKRRLLLLRQITPRYDFSPADTQKIEYYRLVKGFLAEKKNSMGTAVGSGFVADNPWGQYTAYLMATNPFGQRTRSLLPAPPSSSNPPAAPAAPPAR